MRGWRKTYEEKDPKKSLKTFNDTLKISASPEDALRSILISESSRRFNARVAAVSSGYIEPRDEEIRAGAEAKETDQYNAAVLSAIGIKLKNLAIEKSKQLEGDLAEINERLIQITTDNKELGIRLHETDEDMARLKVELTQLKEEARKLSEENEKLKKPNPEVQKPNKQGILERAKDVLNLMMTKTGRACDSPTTLPSEESSSDEK